MKRVRSLPEFRSSFQNDQNEEKKVMIVTVDGGPDENPRYKNTINCAIEYFVENDLDAFFLATNEFEVLSIVLSAEWSNLVKN